MIQYTYPNVKLKKFSTEPRPCKQVELLCQLTFLEENHKLSESHSDNYSQQVLEWVAKLELALFDNLTETLLEFQQLSLDLQCDVWDVIAQNLS